MSKKFPFRGPFDKQHGKPTQTLLESGQQQIYKNYWSLWTSLNWKKSLLVLGRIFRLFLNTLGADDKYYFLNRDNLTEPIQILLPRKQKTFSEFFYW